MTAFLRLILIASCIAAAQPVLAVDARVLDAQERRIETIARLAPSVVAVFGKGEAGGGSGVLISADGFAVTNFHVTSGAGTFMKCGLNDGKLYDAVIVGIDPTGDVALIQLLGRNDFPAAKIGDSDALRVGEWVYALGNPFLLATDFQPTVTYGIVSGVHRYQYPAGTILEYTDCIQVDASINPGNSGGPLFNSAGELIGINGRISVMKSKGKVNAGAGYAISINQVVNFMDHLRSGRVVDHASLGATVKTQFDGSIAVDRILESSDAWRRGLREGDEIVSFAGRPIRSVNQFKNILGIYPKGWKLPLVFRNADGTQKTFVRLAGLHRDSLVKGPAPKMPGQRPRMPHPPGGPKAAQPKEPTVPKMYLSMHSAKPGFANYYFNEQQQQRVLKAVVSSAASASAAGQWRLSGQTKAGDAFEFVLSAEGAGLELGRDAWLQTLDDFNAANEPSEAPGLLMAFYKLRQFHVDELKPLQYLGSEPLDGGGPRADVLVHEGSLTMSHWYVDKTSNAFVGFDLWIDPDDDPCEVRVSETQDFDGRILPSRFVVRYGGLEFAQFEIEHVETKPAATDRGA